MKTYFYLTHLTAEIIKQETICKFMALRHSDSYTTRWGSPYICGCSDVWNPEGRFRARKCERGSDGRRYHNLEVSLIEHREYVVSYLHGGLSIYNQGLDIQIEWHIKENGIRFPGESENSTSDEYAVSDSD